MVPAAGADSDLPAGRNLTPCRARGEEGGGSAEERGRRREPEYWVGGGGRRAGRKGGDAGAVAVDRGGRDAERRYREWGPEIGPSLHPSHLIIQQCNEGPDKRTLYRPAAFRVGEESTSHDPPTDAAQRRAQGVAAPVLASTPRTRWLDRGRPPSPRQPPHAGVCPHRSTASPAVVGESPGRARWARAAPPPPLPAPVDAPVNTVATLSTPSPRRPPRPPRHRTGPRRALDGLPPDDAVSRHPIAPLSPLDFYLGARFLCPFSRGHRTPSSVATPWLPSASCRRRGAAEGRPRRCRFLWGAAADAAAARVDLWAAPGAGILRGARRLVVGGPHWQRHRPLPRFPCPPPSHPLVLLGL